MVKVYIKERINDQTTISAGGSPVTPRILGFPVPQDKGNVGSWDEIGYGIKERIRRVTGEPKNIFKTTHHE